MVSEKVDERGDAYTMKRNQKKMKDVDDDDDRSLLSSGEMNSKTCIADRRPFGGKKKTTEDLRSVRTIQIWNSRMVATTATAAVNTTTNTTTNTAATAATTTTTNYNNNNQKMGIPAILHLFPTPRNPPSCIVSAIAQTKHHHHPRRFLRSALSITKSVDVN